MWRILQGISSFVHNYWLNFSHLPKHELTLLVCTLYFSTEQLTWHGGHIPENLLYVKLGGDHGQGSMKFEFQLAMW